MRAKYRIASIAVGVVFLAVPTLLLATSLTGSPMLAAVTIVISIVCSVGGLLLLLKVMDRYSESANRTATQLSNLNKRLERALAADSETDAELRAEMATLRDRASPVERLVAVEEQVATHDRELRTLHRRVPDGYPDPVKTEVRPMDDEVRTELGLLDVRMTSIGKDVQDSWALGADSALQLGRRPRAQPAGATRKSLAQGRKAAPAGATSHDHAPRAVVVAMKPQIAGRIRRNIMTLLELGFEVTVVNSTPRVDFFQGLDHPNLVADFIDVRSLAVLYQARMTRKKNERAAARDQEKKDRALKSAEPTREAPDWMMKGMPGTEILYRGWTSENGREIRKRVEKTWKVSDRRVTKFLNTSRQKRDLTIRDQLKQVHLINRFVEFWRLSPDRIAEHKPDLIMSDDLPGLVGASIAARRLGVPHIHDCHELYLESTTLRPYEKRVLWPVEKAYMKRADAVVIVNETIRDEYEKRYGVRGIVLRNAAPAVPLEVRANPMDLRALAGIPRHSKVVLYQGGLVPGRGLDVCVKAAVHLPEDMHIVLVGKGKMHDELVAMVEELGVADRVHFLPAVEPSELPAYTAGADIGVIPYQPVSRNNEYALPNKAFEYPGAGIPFVAADLPELRRIVEATRCGEVYDAFSPEALAAAVCTVLDPDRHLAYRQNAVTFGRENTWESERVILVDEIGRLTSRGDGG